MVMAMDISLISRVQGLGRQETLWLCQPLRQGNGANELTGGSPKASLSSAAWGRATCWLMMSLMLGTRMIRVAGEANDKRSRRVLISDRKISVTLRVMDPETIMG